MIPIWRRTSSRSSVCRSTAVPQDAAVRRREERPEELRERGLPRAVLAHERDHVARADPHRDAAQGLVVGVRVREVHVLDDELLERLHPLARRGASPLRRGPAALQEAVEVLEEEARLEQARDALEDRLDARAEQPDRHHRGSRLGQADPVVEHERDQQRERGTGDDHGRERAPEPEHQAAAHVRAQVVDVARVAVVPPAQERRPQPEGAHLLRLEPAEQRLDQVEAQPVPRGLGVVEVELDAPGRPGDEPERQGRDEQHRHEQRLDQDQRQRQPGDAHDPAERRDQALRERQGLGERVGLDPLEVVEELGRLEGLEVHGGRDVERRLERRSPHVLTEQPLRLDLERAREARERARGDEADQGGERVVDRPVRRGRIEDRLERELGQQHLNAEQDGDQDLRGRAQVEERPVGGAGDLDGRAGEPGQPAHRLGARLRREVVLLPVERLGLGRSLRAVVGHRIQDMPERFAGRSGSRARDACP